MQYKLQDWEKEQFRKPIPVKSDRFNRATKPFWMLMAFLFGIIVFFIYSLLVYGVTLWLGIGPLFSLGKIPLGFFGYDLVWWIQFLFNFSQSIAFRDAVASMPVQSNHHEEINRYRDDPMYMDLPGNIYHEISHK